MMETELHLHGSLSSSSSPKGGWSWRGFQGSGSWDRCTDGRLAGHAQHKGCGARWLMLGRAGEISLIELAGIIYGHFRSGTRARTSIALSCSVICRVLLRKQNHIHHGLQKFLNAIEANPSLLSKYPFWRYFIVALVVKYYLTTP